MTSSDVIFHSQHFPYRNSKRTVSFGMIGRQIRFRSLSQSVLLHVVMVIHLNHLNESSCVCAVCPSFHHFVEYWINLSPVEILYYALMNDVSYKYRCCLIIEYFML